MWVALPVITVAREAKAPMPSRMRSVWPWTTRIASSRTPRASPQTWAMTVSIPCPIEAAPVTTSTRPSASTRDPDAVEGTEPALLDEVCEAEADHLAPRPPAGDVVAKRIVVDEAKRLVEETGIVARVETDRDAQGVEVAREGHLLLRDQVDAADLDRVEAEPAGDLVDHPLADEGALVAARARDRCRRASCW